MLCVLMVSELVPKVRTYSIYMVIGAGADGWTQTHNLRITKQVSYHCATTASFNNGTAYFEKFKQLLECQNLLLLSDIWWSKF
jgi:hypothetical protein